jgi:hypothetical protein
MPTEHSADRRRRARTPFLTFVVAAVVVAGLAIGVQSLRSATSASAFAAPTPSAASAIVNDSANRVARPRTTPVVAQQACLAMDATAFTMYCGAVQRTHVADPRATWQACEAMDATAYGVYCIRGDGGRWIAGSEGDSVVH